jgi:hypothetical protein
MPKRRVPNSSASVALGHEEGQICPFVWAWFKGERDLDIAPDLNPAYQLLGDWYRLFRQSYPDAPPPRGLEDRPDLALKLAMGSR